MNIRYPIYEGVYRILTLRQGFHEKYAWNEMRRKIFHQENRRWALRQSFEMQSTLREKSVGLCGRRSVMVTQSTRGGSRSLLIKRSMI